eukprot:1122840-Prymnesium_polylepis.1
MVSLIAERAAASATEIEYGPPTTGLGGTGVCSNQPFSSYMYLETAPDASPATIMAPLGVDQPLTTGVHHLAWNHPST